MVSYIPQNFFVVFFNRETLFAFAETISTKYQLEITEVGRLDCFIDLTLFVIITYIRQQFPSTLELK